MFDFLSHFNHLIFCLINLFLKLYVIKISLFDVELSLIIVIGSPLDSFFCLINLSLALKNGLVKLNLFSFTSLEFFN